MLKVTKKLEESAEKVVNEYRKNKVVMDFVTKEALEKTASDIREKTKSGTTAKAVELLMITNKKIEERVNNYISTGLTAVIMAHLGISLPKNA